MVEKRKVIEFKNEEGVIMSGLNQVTLDRGMDLGGRCSAARSRSICCGEI